MKLTFVGTRGEIDLRTPLHARHTSLLASHRRSRVMVDCGLDWLDAFAPLRPAAIVITHAHPDHAWGLRHGAGCPVHATSDAWKEMRGYPIASRRDVKPRRPFRIGTIQFEAFSVEHSIRAPAVGYRITAGRVSVFYSPDVVYIHERGEALMGVRLYIGDGATIERSFVRKRGERLIGHAPVRTQLTWCRAEQVPRMIVTHCGREIVGGDAKETTARIEAFARERGVEAVVAFDGMEIVLR